MVRSLYSGVAGLRTHQTKMDVIGNNIANVNTVAFKSSAVTFSDILYQTTSGASQATENTGGKNPNQIGLGVMAGSTKVSIESGGAAQSTGEAFDIKLTDSNNTNFFIVNNGSQNLFTRAGSFYVDGNGNLAMTSTGYMVQGWGVDPVTQTIVKDTVQPLRILQPTNKTSAPEATTEAIATGIVDKNSPTITSNDGYVMSLSFYDQLGYSYTAKFAVHAIDTKEGEYNVELTDILDASNKSILEQYTSAAGITPAPTVQDLWGEANTTPKSYSLTNATGYSVSGTTITINDGDYKGYTADLGNGSLSGSGETMVVQFKRPTGSTAAGTDNPHNIPLKDIFSINKSVLAGATTTTTKLAVSENGGKLVATIDTPSIAYNLKFNANDGSFAYVGNTGEVAQTLKLSALNKLYQNGGPFSDVNFNFSQTKNLDNGGTSTLGADRGDTSGTIGLGKKIGNMTGVSVDQTGKIYGSYDNGNTVLLGQIAVAQFANASGLEALGNNCYAETLNSGEFDGIGVEVNADGGSMTTGELEMSNVDLSKEFTEMITTQRGFQANSRIITVSDTMLEELVNLKR